MQEIESLWRRGKGLWRRPGTLALAGWGLLLLLVVLLTVQLNGRLTERPNTGDALSNAQVAYTLAETGRFATAPRRAPSMYREPLPVIALAAQIAVDPRFSRVTDIEQLNEMPAIIALKQHNLAWAFALLLGVPFVVRGFIRNRPVWFLCSAAGIVLTTVFFLENANVVDRNLTEIQAAVLLIWSAVVSWLAVETRKLRYFLILGLLAGGLVLTKAVFFYIIWVYLALLLLLMLVGSLRFPVRQGAICLAVALLGAVMVIGPWSVRNYVHFGTFSVAERGGVILWIRAVKNQMTDDEWLGAFYLYSQAPVSTWIGERFSITPEHFEINGPLRRLSRSGNASFAEADSVAEREGRPEDAISFIRAARAERSKLRAEYRAQGYPSPSTSAEEELQRRAIAEILAHPVSHVRATPVFFWRGMWSVRSDRFSSTIDSYAAVIGMLALWGMALGGLVARRPAVFGSVGLSVGMVAFYAVATHGIPRYTVPAIPTMIVSISIVVGWAALAVMPRVVRVWRYLKTRLTPSRIITD